MFCVKKWCRNQHSFTNAHKSRKKLFTTRHEGKTSNIVFSKLAFCNFDLWNTTPQCRIELLRQFFFQNTPGSLYAMPQKSQNQVFQLCVWLLRSHHKYRCIFTFFFFCCFFKGTLILIFLAYPAFPPLSVVPWRGGEA